MSAARPGPVLVTGANSGIGLATTLDLAQRGWSVWGSVRSPESEDELRKQLAEAGVESSVHPLRLDVADHDAVVAAWPELPDFYGVVNNAGYSETGAVEDVSAARARRQLDVNLVAPAVVSACALPGMRRRGEGRIVMISSIAGRASVLPLNGWYHASKFGLEGLSDVLRVEVASFGVRVCIVEPGFFKTRIGALSKQAAHTHPPESPYAAAYGRVRESLELVERFAPAPTPVARAIRHAIESRRPRRRYVVGADAIATLAGQSVTPREVTDLAMRWFAGLTR